ncbi:MAG: radical SAM protein, partial [Planctomycetes bacterium]|nr:radical SAM protein [Planctomycetota bacterium]
EKEMDIYMRILGLDKIKTRSVLIGGGTPTFLTPAQLKRFLDGFVKRHDISRCKQFNYDVDPATLIGPDGLERLKIMRDYGVDRLTIGVQSLNEEILHLMNRTHDAKQAIESIENSWKFGYKVNIEYIFGHPGQTIDLWIEEMEDAIATGVTEIQLYRLKVEAYGDYQGPIKKYKRIRPDNVPTAEDAIRMKQLSISMLNRAGYHETLRRVFSKDHRIFSVYAHNQCCSLFDEIGYGLTSFSSMRDRFGLNTQYFEEYYSMIEKGRLPLTRGLVRGTEEQMRWAIILPLKNRDVRKPYFKKVTGGQSLDHVFRGKIETMKQFGLVEEDDMVLRLTTLGKFFADECMQQFESVKYIPYPQSEYADGPLNPYRDGQP